MVISFSFCCCSRSAAYFVIYGALSIDLIPASRKDFFFGQNFAILEHSEKYILRVRFESLLRKPYNL